MFGPHLTLDLYGCERSTLKSIPTIYKILDELPNMLGMHKIAEPQITPYAGREDSFDKGGVSAFVLIAESHITIHTFLEQRYVSIDIFSCKEFDVEQATAYMVNAFKAKKVERNLLSRGREFPKDVKKVKPIIAKERSTIERESSTL